MFYGNVNKIMEQKITTGRGWKQGTHYNVHNESFTTNRSFRIDGVSVLPYRLLFSNKNCNKHSKRNKVYFRDIYAITRTFQG